MRLHRRESAFYAILTFAVIVTAVFFVASWDMKKVDKNQIFAEKEYEKYKYHYVLIQPETTDEVFQNLYLGAKKAGEKRNILVEDAGSLGTRDKTVEEMLETAIAAKVDGIILKADHSPGIQELINEASEKNIPVATVEKDLRESKRRCFIGADIKQLSGMFAHRIQEQYHGKTLDVAVLTEPDKEPVSESLYELIKKEVGKRDVSVRPVEISREYAFSADEKIRSLFLDRKAVPDVLVCLNEIDTVCACKAVVDYNMVGKVKIIGFSASEEILSAIEKEILDSSLVIDAAEMGEKAVSTLFEKRNEKSGNSYILTSPKVIDKENINWYRKEKR